MARLMQVVTLSAALAALVGTSLKADGANQEATDVCIDHLRQAGAPEGQSGKVLSSAFSEAGTLVRLQDAGGSIWRCIAYSDGTIGDFSLESAGGDAVVEPTQEPTTDTVYVKFAAGDSGAELEKQLSPGSSTRYVLGANAGQNLYVRVAPEAPDISYQIFNPDQSFLLDQMTSDREYRGKLWQSGDHVIEVINRGSGTASYKVTFSIE